MLKRPSYLKCVILAENEKGFQFWDYLHV
jgi:hypothetical protein